MVAIAAGFTTIFNFIMLWFKPLREKILGTQAVQEGLKCVMRSIMLSTYYKCQPDAEIRQMELENYLKLYLAYKAMGGNSFIDEITKDVKEFRVIR